MVRPAALTFARHPLAALLGERGRLMRFVLTGGIAGLTQLLLLELFSGHGLPALAANGLAFLLAAQVNFWLSALFTWRDRADDLSAGSVATRLVRFHGAIVGTALLNMAVFAVAVTVLPEMVAAVLGIGVAAAVNFVTGDRFVFRRVGREPLRAQIARAVIIMPPDAPAHEPDAASGDLAADDDDGDGPVAVGGPTGPARRFRFGDRGRLWARLGMAGVVLLGVVLYCWGLSRNGMGNEYYTAAALSGAISWKAFFFGSLDPGSFITVDKPPAALWVQALSVRLFGLSSWSVLLPQAFLALGTLLALMTMTRRQFSAPAAILAGLVLVLTPVTVAVARVNLPDTLLILLMGGGVWATLVSIKRGQLRWLLLGVALVGVGFNAKMLQAFIVAPAIFATYLLTAPGGLFKRVAHLTLAALMLLGVSASWMLVVDAIPAESRPYIGGSSDNTVLDLALGYNGLGRVFGQGLARGASPSEIVARLVSALSPAEADPNGAQPAGNGGFGAGGAGNGARGQRPARAQVPGQADDGLAQGQESGTPGQAVGSIGAAGAPAGPSGGPGAPNGGPGAPNGGPGAPNGGPGAPGGPGGPGGFGGPGFGGQPGILRLYNDQIGGQIGWLLPLAFAGLLAGLVATARRPRTDLTRAWYLLWGGWLVTHAVVFSFASGIMHPYYTAALGPSIAALVGPGVVALWQGYRRGWWLVLALPVSLAGTAAVSVYLVSRSTWLPWLAPTIIGAAGVGVAGLLLARLIRRPIGRQFALGALTVGLVGVLAGPTAWAMTPLRASGMAVNPQAGPPDSTGFGRGGPGGGPGAAPGGPPPGVNGGQIGQGGPFAGGPFGMPPGFQPPSGQDGMGMAPGFRQGRNGGGTGPVAGQQPGGPGGPGGFGGPGGPGGFGGPGGPGGFGGPGGPGGFGGPGGPGGRLSQEMLAYLQANRGSAEYLVAVNSSMAAAPIILETRLPVVAMGGFSGGDPAPTAEGLAELVASGRLRFVMLGGRGGPCGGPGGLGGGNIERSTWIQEHCSVVEPSLYDPAPAATQENADGSPVVRNGQQLYDCAPATAAVDVSNT